MPSPFYVVTGAPCSGKTTWVAKHRQGRTAVVLDLDAIHVALGSDVQYLHSRRLLDYATIARDTIVKEWRTGSIHAPALYYVSCAPSADEIRTFPHWAEFVPMRTTEEECKRRAIADKRPARTLDLIHRWFMKHGTP